MTEDPRERAKRLATHTEAARAGVFAAASDILATMTENGVSEAPACVMAGVLEMAVQTWVQVSMRAGVMPMKARQTFEKEAKLLWTKHMRIERAVAAPPPPKLAIEHAHPSALVPNPLQIGPHND